MEGKRKWSDATFVKIRSVIIIDIKGKVYFIVCGRFVRYISIPEIAAEFDADASGLDIKASYSTPLSKDIRICRTLQ